MKKIVLTGGGTAGHVVPNIALLPELRKNFDEIHYIGSIKGIERNILKNYPFVYYHPISTVKFIRSLTLKNLAIPFKLLKGIFEAKKIIKKIKPAVIFSKGGFVAVPVVFAGSYCKIPIVAHESDYSMGLANKIIYRKCNSMCFSFQECMGKKYSKKGVFSGSPIRKEFFQKNTNIPSSILVDTNKKTILVIGGSLGAMAINEAILEGLPILSRDYNIINIVGKNNIKKDLDFPNYNQIEYINNIAPLFQVADLIISRAGSNTIFEILACKKPMILIPLPKGNSRGDQLLNAKNFEKQGFAKILYQENLNKDSLILAIKECLKNKDSYKKKMNTFNSTKGSEKVLKEILKYSK